MYISIYSNRFHPGKAIDLIDKAGSFVGDDEEGLVGLTYLELLKELKWMKEVMLKTKEDMDAFGDKDFKKVYILSYFNFLGFC